MASDKNLRFTFSGVDNVTQVMNNIAREMRKLERATRDHGRSMEEAGRSSLTLAQRSQMVERAFSSAERQYGALAKAGQGLVVMGAALGFALGVVAKQAIEWESSFAGVRKVVEGTPEQIARLEAELRGLARTLPASHREIAAVAESAGQLGVKREDIAKFTKTMIMLGVSTNLSADQAANALARFSNIMGTPTSKVDRLGAALVALGNDGASTEAEIMSMALRIAGAGKTIGMTEGDVLGLANALSSVGINAEAGGSSISTAMIKIASAVNAGGKEVEAFARVAGMSADQFSQQWRTAPAQALTAFIQGLGRMVASGQDAFGVLDSLGLSEIRVRDAMLRTANAGDLLASSIRLGNTAFQENRALVEEANRRFNTTAARIQIAKNNMTDFAISLGNAALPIIGQVAGKIASLGQVLSQLPGPARTTVMALGGAVTVASLLGGAALMAVPKLVGFWRALEAMGKVGLITRAALSGIGSFLAGPWGLAIAGATAILGFLIMKKVEAAEKTREYTRAIEEDSFALGANTRATIVHNLEKQGLLRTAQQLGFSLRQVADAVMNEGNAYNQTIAIIDRKLESMRANADANRGQITDLVNLRNAITGENKSIQEAMESARRKAEAMGQDAQATTAAAGAAVTAAGANTNLAAAGQTAAGAMDAAKRAADNLKNSLDALTGAAINEEQALINQARAADSATKAADGHRRMSIDERQAIIDLARANQELIIKMAENGAGHDELSRKDAYLRQQMINTAMKMGASRAEAERLTDKYYGQRDAVNALINSLNRVPARKSTQIQVYGSGQYRVTYVPEGQLRGGRGPQFQAAGGPIYGPGGPTSDAIPAYLSNGEYVIRASAHRRYGTAFFDALNAERFADGGTVFSRSYRNGPGGMAQWVTRTNSELDQWVSSLLIGAIKRALASLPSAIFGPGGLGGVSSGTAAANMALGMRMAAALGWTGAQWEALRQLWIGESGWNHRARNASSGAYGIPQALPAGKMASAGADWATNPATQIRWGLGYIRQRYGSPLNAWRFWLSQSPHWYDRGGILPPGLTLAYNGTGENEYIARRDQIGGLTVNVYVQGHTLHDKRELAREVVSALQQFRSRGGHVPAFA